MFYSAALLHASIGLTPYQPDRDRDDDSPAMEMEEALLHSNPALFLAALCANEETTGLHCGALGATSEQMPAQDEEPRFSNLLSAAGLGSAATPAVVIASPLAAPWNTGIDHGKSAREQGGETTPEVPNPSPLILPPPAGAKDSPPPVSSPGGPFADLLPMDLEAIRCSADAFFAHLARLSEEWYASGVIEKLTPWLVAASVVAYKWVRLRRKQAFSAPDSEDSWESGPTVFLMGDEG